MRKMGGGSIYYHSALPDTDIPKKNIGIEFFNNLATTATDFTVAAEVAEFLSLSLEKVYVS